MTRGPSALHVETLKVATSSKKANWKYRIRYYDERDGKRKQISKNGFSTKDAAFRAGEYALQDLKDMLLVENPDVFKLTLSEFVDQVWLPHMSTNWNDATKLNRKKLLKYITSEFGGMKLKTITPAMIKVFFDKLYLVSPIATSSVNNIRSTFSQIFIFAQEQGYVRLSPLASYDPPNPNEFPAICNKGGQVRDVIPDSIMDQIYTRFPKGTPAYVLIKISEHTGMRISEAAALAFEDVDFSDRKIYVSRQIKIIGISESFKPYEAALIEKYPELASCKYVTRNPKYNSKRVVALSQELYDILMEAKQEQEENARLLGNDYTNYWYTREYDPKFSERTFETFNRKRGKGGYYAAETFENGIINTYGIGYPLHFINIRPDGTLLRPTYSNDICDVIQGGNGRPVIYADFNFHSLRNSFASRRRADGIPEHIISAMLGHKNETTTEKYMRIDYSQFDKSTRSYRGMTSQAADSSTSISDNSSLEDYLKTLDRAGLKAAMDSVYEHLMAST